MHIFYPKFLFESVLFLCGFGIRMSYATISRGAPESKNSHAHKINSKYRNPPRRVGYSYCNKGYPTHEIE